MQAIYLVNLVYRHRITTELMIVELLRCYDKLPWGFLLEAAYISLILSQSERKAQKRVMKWIECMIEVVFMKQTISGTQSDSDERILKAIAKLS